MIGINLKLNRHFVEFLDQHLNFAIVERGSQETDCKKYFWEYSLFFYAMRNEMHVKDVTGIAS